MLLSLPKNIRDTIWISLDVLMACIGIVSFVALIAEIGFYVPSTMLPTLATTINVLVYGFILQQLLRFLIVPSVLEFLRENWIDNVLVVLLLVQQLFPNFIRDGVTALFPELTVSQATLSYFAFTQVILVLALLAKGLRYNSFVARLKLHPGAIFVLSFGLIIVLGMLLLLMPRSTTNGISALDAFFTSTSAVCVTGLIVMDTAKDFTPLGQTIIMILIQIGGLGVMTLTTFFALFFSGGISVRERLMMSSILSEDNVGEVSKLLVRITVIALTIEAIGALLLYLSADSSIFPSQRNAVYSAVFHSISAYCNAGFALYSDGLYDASIRDNFQYHSVIMVLIILGGLGFAAIANILKFRPWKLNRPSARLSVSTKLILIATVYLIFSGTVSITFVESSQLFGELTWFETFFQSLFFSVSSRTAGFNIFPVEGLSVASIFIMIFLMWVGGAPGSTAGGVKNLTVAVAALNAYNTILGKQRVEIFHREISQSTIRTAFSVMLVSVFLLGGSWVLLILLEPHLNPIDLMFEATSALSTVGLTRGITSQLSTTSKIVVILLMFVGRVGIMTVLFALVNPTHEARYHYPKESISVL
jgi:potassium uptake TrkH family protein